jgi:hypothetical protein
LKNAVIQKEFERLRPEYEKAFADMDPPKWEAQIIEVHYRRLGSVLSLEDIKQVIDKELKEQIREKL